MWKAVHQLEMGKLAIGVLGCGTIGQEVIEAVIQREVQNADITGIHDRNPGRVSTFIEQFGLTSPPRLTETPQSLTQNSDLVLECAGHSAIEEYAEDILSTGTDLMALSVGALADADLHEDLLLAAEQNDSRLRIPSGALAGVDAIKGAAVADQLDEVIFTTIKPPTGLAGAPYILEEGIDLEGIEISTLVFEGTAREAAPAFPSNINVAMALSLAGIGPEQTAVKIFADPAEDDNVHKIEAVGAAGTLELAFHTAPHPDNPKTSYIAALSAIASLQRLTEPLVVGS